MNKNLYIMIGVPGSGKSTWIKENIKDPIVCSADHYYDVLGYFAWQFLNEAHLECDVKAESAMIEGKDNIVIDNTNLTNTYQVKWVELAEKYGYFIKYVVLKPVPFNPKFKWFVSFQRWIYDVKIGWKLARRNLHNVPYKSI